jgi:hypothetical protein
MDNAVDLVAWANCLDVGTLDDYKGNIGLCFDVSIDGLHVTLAAAALTRDGRVRVEIIDDWDSVNAARRAMPEWVAKIKPRAYGWFPKGPAAVLGADLKGGDAEALADISAVCLGLAEQVSAGKILHSGDALLTHQLGGTARVWTGDAWRFARKGVGQCDAVYALAGAVYLARTLPPPRSKLAIA